VVGVNTAIASRSGGFQGIGFAIPSNQAKAIYATLKEKGKITRGWLGVAIEDVSKDPEDAKSLGYTGTKGILVKEVFPKTPAYGKLQPSDVIVALNGKPAEDVQHLRSVIALTAPGSDVVMRVFRDGKEQDVTIKVAEQPEDAMALKMGRNGPQHNGGAEAPSEALGMKLTNLSEDLATKYELNDAKGGALVTAVTPRSAAARAGLRPGDLITKVDKTVVSDAKQAIDALSKGDLSKGVRLYITNSEGSSFRFLRDTKE
jgi:serine protease Do